MKAGIRAAALLAVCFLVATVINAQLGMDIFKRPSITKTFHLVVGKGAAYQSTDKNGGTRSTEIGVIGKDSVDGKDGFWMEFVSGANDGKPTVGKALITTDDFQFHRMILQQPGHEAMELPMNMMGARANKMDEHLADWHSAGSQTITVPAGTFSCDHWVNDKTHAEVWTSDKITPFGMVKEINGSGGTEVLVKVLDSFSDRITGAVKQFDMQQMMQEMQQRRQQKP